MSKISTVIQNIKDYQKRKLQSIYTITNHNIDYMNQNKEGKIKYKEKRKRKNLFDRNLFLDFYPVSLTTQDR